jgi:integrase
VCATRPSQLCRQEQASCYACCKFRALSTHTGQMMHNRHFVRVPGHQKHGLGRVGGTREDILGVLPCKRATRSKKQQGQSQAQPMPHTRYWGRKIRKTMCVTRPSDLRERALVTMLCVLHTHTHTHRHTHSCLLLQAGGTYNT